MKFTCLAIIRSLGSHHHQVNGAYDVQQAIVGNTYTIAIWDVWRLQLIQHLKAGRGIHY